MYTSLELCAGAGGQAVGLERAGFVHLALVDYEPPACETLRLNRPEWNVIEADLNHFSATGYCGSIDLVAGGVPCPPFSKAGKQLGSNDERDLFPAAIRIVRETMPRAIMIENVSGLLDAKFNEYREEIACEFEKMGYQIEFRLLNASDFGVPQLRPRVIMVGLTKSLFHHFKWPQPQLLPAPTVGEALGDLMAEGGWPLAQQWAAQANKIAPTLVGGSKKHGGPDLGPTRAKRAWAELGVNGHLLKDEPPSPDFVGKEGFEDMPYLTVRMAARIQGFPADWAFFGKKTAAYRQVGNAFPPPVSEAVGREIYAALRSIDRAKQRVQREAKRLKQIHEQRENQRDENREVA